jgi:hypothetical protein
MEKTKIDKQLEEELKKGFGVLFDKGYNQALQDVKDLWLRLPEDTCEYTFEEELMKLKK